MGDGSVDKKTGKKSNQKHKQSRTQKREVNNAAVK